MAWGLGRGPGLAGFMGGGLAGLGGWRLGMGLVRGLVGVLRGRGTAALARRPERSAAVIAMPAPLPVLPSEGDRELIPYSINAIARRV